MKDTISFMTRVTVKVEDTLSMDEMAEIALQGLRKSNRDYELRKALRALPA